MKDKYSSSTSTWNLNDTTNQWIKADSQIQENKLTVTNGEKEKEKGKKELGDQEVQTTICKISYKNVSYSAGNLANVL